MPQKETRGHKPFSSECSQFAAARVVSAGLARRNVHHYEAGEEDIVPSNPFYSVHSPLTCSITKFIGG